MYILACSCRYIDKEVEQDRSRVRIEQVLAPSMQLSGRGSQEQRSIGASFAPLQAMTNDGKSSWPCNSGFSGPWASSWPCNGGFGGPWTSSWLWNGGFGSSWTSSWLGFGGKAGRAREKTKNKPERACLADKETSALAAGSTCCSELRQW